MAFTLWGREAEKWGSRDTYEARQGFSLAFLSLLRENPS